MSKGQKLLATYITDNYDKAVFLTAAKMEMCIRDRIISGPMQRHCFNTEWMPIICIGDRKHPWSCRI